MRVLAHFALASMLTGVAPAAAEDSSEWLRVSSPNENFSAEIPCTPAQISYQRTLVPDVGGAATSTLTNDLPNRVMCIVSASEIHVATLIRMPEATPAGGTLFVQFLAEMGVQIVEGESRIIRLDGHRAFVNREMSEGVIAESGLIEVGRDGVLLYNSSNLSSADPERVDRFRDSIRIGVQ